MSAVRFVAGELRKQGVKVKLQEQPFQILQILLKCPGEVVTREVELYHVLLTAYDQQPIDEERIGKVYEYASWCFEQPDTGDVATVLSSAVAVSFIEDIPLNQRISDDLHRWVSAESFDGF